jgi:polysaccharide pyruvyl transferase WcaK-like protein/SAM-dependent methyltransferase
MQDIEDGLELPRIALYGTFDVLNFGDLLFPHLLRHGLGPSEQEIAAFSPVGGRLAWADTVVSQPVHAAVEFGADLHIIGGGNIIHAGTTSLADYQAAGIDPRHAYASLWLGAGLIAAQSDTTLAWNAPGLPAPLEGAALAALRDDILAASSYVSVRDRASFKFLGAQDADRSVVVPDTALDIGRVWPAATLLDHARQAFIQRGATVPERWMVFHVNSRYLEGDTAHHAAVIEAVAATFEAVPVLLAFGPCHGDDLLAAEVGALLRVPSLLVDRPCGLKEIASLLAFSAGYIGSSMHGLITALSYGTPAIAVAKKQMVKFGGFLDHLAMPDRLAESWSEAQGLAARLLRPLDRAAHAAIARAQDQIALHWAWLRGLLDAEPPASVLAARIRLRHWMAQATTGGNEWRSFEAVIDGAAPVTAAPTIAQSPSVAAPTDAPAVLVPCNICGKTGFRPNTSLLHDQVGFGARCAACGSPARHRAMRVVLDWWRAPDTKLKSCLRLGINRVVAGGWFASLSDIDVENGKPVDLSELPRLRHSADLVVCMDVLERAPDLVVTLRGLRDALRPRGLLFLTFSNVPGRERTLEWGFPRGDLGKEYRKFGTDVMATLRHAWPEGTIAVATPADPLTGIRSMVYVLAQTTEDLRWLRVSYLPCEIYSPEPHSQAAARAK